MSSLTRCIILIVLLLLSAFFSMTESAFSYCNQIKLKVAADEGSKSAKLALKCLKKFDKYLISGLIGNNIVNIIFSVLSTMLCISILNESFNIELNKANDLSAIITPIVSTIIVFFLGEIIPKGIGKTLANKICQICVYPLIAISFILTPLSLIFQGMVFLVKKLFKSKDEDVLIDEEDFQNIVDSIEEKGLIEEQESNIIQSAVDFDDTKVKQVMCSVENVYALDIAIATDKDKLLDFVLTCSYTRIPVYKDNINNIIGILHVQKLLKAIMQKKEYSIEKLLVKPIFVKPNVHLDTLFEEFKKKKTHMAVVNDKDNNTLGIVTMEDVLEELVGDIDESNEGGVSHE
ncbi:MAG: hemolysin family protein [Candidatus Caccosoma sp.]|nr:hemolysin family protein [Candidatus Caccosoma sp.]